MYFPASLLVSMLGLACRMATLVLHPGKANAQFVQPISSNNQSGFHLSHLVMPIVLIERAAVLRWIYMPFEDLEGVCQDQNSYTYKQIHIYKMILIYIYILIYIIY